MSETQDQNQAPQMSDLGATTQPPDQSMNETQPFKLMLTPAAKKVQTYISGLSERALRMQIKSQKRDGEKMDLMYSSMLEAELQKRMDSGKARKG